MQKKEYMERHNDIWKPVEQLRMRCDEAYDFACKQGEDLATATFGIPDDGKKDICAPPDKPERVECWHCGDKYSSSKMVYEYRLHYRQAMISLWAEGHYFPDGTDAFEDGISPMWWCRNADCDGAGFGYDIHPVNKRNYRKPQ